MRRCEQRKCTPYPVDCIQVRAYEQEISEKSVKLAEIEASLHATTVNGDGTLFEQEKQSLQMLADRESTIEHLKYA